jgi:hypothetical protein
MEMARLTAARTEFPAVTLGHEYKQRWRSERYVPRRKNGTPFGRYRNELTP